MTNDLNQHILVHLQTCENTIGIRTYQRDIGRKGRFLICRDSLQDWLNGDRKNPFYDMDCGNVLHIQARGNILHFCIYWVCSSYEKLWGNKQSFSIPADKVCSSVYSGVSIHYLHVPQPYNCKVKLRVEHEKMQKILHRRKTRHAFRKAMREEFHWRDETVTLYHDGGADFSFRTSSGHPSCGGLILHETTVHDVSDSYPKLYYSVHT